MDDILLQLIAWSGKFKSLPWRQNRSVYKTLVSEIMLQQTTVGTVLKKYDSFIDKYPTLKDLADSTEEEILISWKGLGYYRRAKNLLNSAKYIKENYNGVIPENYTDLIKIKGIGEYTANALLAIGYNLRALAIDTNIERVVARYYGLDIEQGTKLKKHILTLFDDNKILNYSKSYRALNEALMDLGREYCKSNTTYCIKCPLLTHCKSKENPLLRPQRLPKKNIRYNLDLLRVIICDKQKIWCYQKNTDEWLVNQWECPTFILQSDDVKLKQYARITELNKFKDYSQLKKFKTAITKYYINNYILTISLDEFYKNFNFSRELKPIELSQKDSLSTATHKALVKISNI